MNTSTYIACIACLPALVSYVAAQENDPGVLTVEKISKVPKEIISCKFNYRFHDPRGDRVLTRTIGVDDDKFFVDVGNAQAGFDGEFYWLKDFRRPTLQKEIYSFLPFKQLDTHPLNGPYSWVWSDPKLACWSDLRKEETWKSIAKRMTYQARRTIHHQTCDVFVVDHPESGYKYTVAFSRRLGGFPIQFLLEIKGEHVSTGDVLETHRVGDAVIATIGQVNNKVYGWRPIDSIDWIDVDVDSIQMNQLLDPAIFRPLAVAQIDPNPTLEERYTNVLRDCRLNGYRLMVIRHSGRESVTAFVSKYLTNYQHQKDVARYIPLLVAEGKILDEDDAAFAEAQGWPEVPGGAIMVSVHGTDGNGIDRMTLDVDSSAAVETARAFLAKHAPLPVDAKRKWEEAFALAEETGRRVWAIQGGRYCGPCFRLTRWIDEHADLLARDYVFFKVDAYLDENGQDVADQITRGGQHGVPFHAIFSADGQFLVDSEGPTGNIGMPSGFEGVQHLGEMLNSTRQKSAPSDVDKLLESLR